MPESLAGTVGGVTSGMASAQVDYVSAATGAAGAIAGWAFSSISSRVSLLDSFSSIFDLSNAFF